MLSLSDNEFHVISFLVRNFTEKLTIRNIAQKLKFSPAGVFNIFKKLEKENIVYGEKLGTGLFYSINFESKIATHLAAICLVYSEEKYDINLDKLRQAKVILFDKKTLLLVADTMSAFDISLPDIKIITKTEDETIASFRKKDPELIQLIKKGVALQGEDKLVEIIKNSTSRF